MTNVVVLVGRLVRDVEVRYTSNELAIAKMTVAVDSGFGEKKKTNYIPVTAFGKTAEFCGKYLGKGRLVSVEGNIATGSYEKQDGTKVFTVDVHADSVNALDKGNSTNEAFKPKEETAPKGFETLDEDIPF